MGKNDPRRGEPAPKQTAPKKKSNTALIFCIVAAVLFTAAVALLLFVLHDRNNPDALPETTPEPTNAGRRVVVEETDEEEAEAQEAGEEEADAETVEEAGETVSKSAAELLAEALDRTVTASAVETTEETAEEPAAEPAGEAAEEPAAEPAGEAAEEPAAEPEEVMLQLPSAEPVSVTARETRDVSITCAVSGFNQVFSPLFASDANDLAVVDLVTGYLLSGERGGAVLPVSSDGVHEDYNGTDYYYWGMGDVEVVQNGDGSVDYKLSMRDDIVFSDGVPATIDDVIFGIYVLADPTYDGPSNLAWLFIEGMEEYRSGMAARGEAIVAAGANNTNFDYWTQAQQNEFLDFYYNQSYNVLAQNIVDFIMDNYAEDYSEAFLGVSYDEVLADENLQVALSMMLWGFGDSYDGSTFTDLLGRNYNTAAGAGPTVEDFGTAIISVYDTIEDAFDVESAYGETAMSVTIDALGPAYAIGVPTGSSAPNITGITRTGDYSMTIHMTEYDAWAIYDLKLPIAPLHYYGDTAQYDYSRNRFGFPKGDLTGVRAKNARPLGCGPYVFQSYAGDTVTLTANPLYYKGAPVTGTILMKKASEADFIPGLVSGSFDIAAPANSVAVIKAVKAANSNGQLSGDTLTTALVDYRGYGYIGINADLVNMGGDPDSEASKNLRKGFMTLFAVYREAKIWAYYGERASVIEYPISNASWAAPKPTDAGYREAYSVDVNGNPIYTDFMSTAQRYEAAKAAAVGFFRAAGLPYNTSTGKFTTDRTFEIIVPGQGEGDHPAYLIAETAAAALNEIGIRLDVIDVGSSDWSNALENNTAMMWAAAWLAAIDPDMTQNYSSANAHGNGTNANHYSIDDAQLDALIVNGLRSADTDERKAIYKEAMEIVMDWGCELPVYQRKDCIVFSTQRIDIDSIPGDMTPYWGWASEIDTLEGLR